MNINVKVTFDKAGQRFIISEDAPLFSCGTLAIVPNNAHFPDETNRERAEKVARAIAGESGTVTFG